MQEIRMMLHLDVKRSIDIHNPQTRPGSINQVLHQTALHTSARIKEVRLGDCDGWYMFKTRTCMPLVTVREYRLIVKEYKCV